ncbi:hypothetical protein A3G50_02180 [Candidatus Jorgensenbacteria bacterium RIFCSPLOWO2_12_FULL_42_11]|uniref:Lipoprotein n=1 Tax=Candidatus Jorgensenbacteria bacterium RIFCSPLOWO2_12_FULL_42_11 TaxID=1798473 RepID=A0A1F6C0V7_9BACT|nr:MAG: hypothetical protein A3G50_02180 [Candidatus Jorgensenbacteria bacterium RIFCSPLOWO2_12_FULL_42_11]
MKKMVIGYWLLVIVLLGGCATTTYIIEGGGLDPAGDAYKKVHIINPTPYYVVPDIGQNIIMKPGAKIITEPKRPFGWFSPTLGSFSFMAYAYRKYDEKTGRLDEFVGQQQHWIYLDGRAHEYQGGIFGDEVVMGYFPVSSFGHPDRWQGSFLGVVPWKAEFKHQ